MNLSNFEILFLLVGLIVHYLIIYFIINSALRNSTYRTNELLKSQLRIMMYDLEKQGYNNAEIARIITTDK